MKWKRIPKEHTIQPSSGVYSDWKQIIADEGFHQCVYCAIHDANFGGIRNFHVEHYRPKSIPRFAKLKNDIKNLYYACPICNTFKSNDWPSDMVDDYSSHCYPDPSQVDYCEIFEVSDSDGIIEGKYLASKYIVERVYLNRPQLIMERRIHFLRMQERAIHQSMQELLQTLDSILDKEAILTIYKRVVQIQDRFLELLNALHEISPYRISDTER